MAEHILVVQRQLVAYRVPFFNRLRECLPEIGMQLRLAVGSPLARDVARGYSVALRWAEPTRCRDLGRWCWQSLSTVLPGADFVVLTQENRLLANWPLLLAPQRFRVGLWGHGANLAAEGAPPGAQRLKNALTARADWCFAYTEGSARRMAASLPRERITVVNNTVDTDELAAQVRLARELPRPALRRELGLSDAPALMFLGSLVPGKKLDGLLDAARTLRRRGVPVQLVIAGGGPLAAWLAAQREDWIHLPGPVLGATKARWLAAADVLLHPAALGLSVLDGFAAGVPLITTNAAGHGPEADYLHDGVNALVCAPDALAAAVQRLLDDQALAHRLAQGGRESARLYTMQAMVDRFVAGAQAWRASVPRRPRRRA